jgi:hypothetical protein
MSGSLNLALHQWVASSEILLLKYASLDFLENVDVGMWKTTIQGHAPVHYSLI